MFTRIWKTGINVAGSSVGWVNRSKSQEKEGEVRNSRRRTSQSEKRGAAEDYLTRYTVSCAVLLLSM